MNNNKPVMFFGLLLPFLFGSGYYSGCEIANGEINQLKAEHDTVQKKIVKASRDVPPQTVLTDSDVVEVDVYANRTVSGEMTKKAEVVGRKAHYGLNKDQVVMVRDLE